MPKNFPIPSFSSKNSILNSFKKKFKRKNLPVLFSQPIWKIRQILDREYRLDASSATGARAFYLIDIVDYNGLTHLDLPFVWEPAEFVDPSLISAFKANLPDSSKSPDFANTFLAFLSNFDLRLRLYRRPAPLLL
jgi:hypothetical protein